MQTSHKDDSRWPAGKLDAERLPAERVGEFGVDGLDDLLAGVQRLRDIGADELFTDAADQRTDHGEVDVGFEECNAYFAEYLVDIGLGQAAFAAELGEDAVETVGEAFEHRPPTVIAAARLLVVPTCSFHVQRNAIGSCQRCSHTWCEDCLRSVQGVPLCLECLATLRGPDPTPGSDAGSAAVAGSGFGTGSSASPLRQVVTPSPATNGGRVGGRDSASSPRTGSPLPGGLLPAGDNRLGGAARTGAAARRDLVGSVRPSPVFLVIVGLFIASCAWASQIQGIGPARWAVRGVVFSGWVLSLCLHEFGHAATAFAGGDHTVADKGYLTLDPRKYAHIGLSLGLPIVFLLLGGIGLPGGAVWINHGLIRSPKLRSLMSFAGPFANITSAVLLAIPLRMGLFDSRPALSMGLSFLALLQVSTALLNLIPIPGLDGFGVLSPFLPASVLRSAAQIRGYGFFLLFMLLSRTGLGNLLWDTSDYIGQAIGIPLQLAEFGRALFSFV